MSNYRPVNTVLWILGSLLLIMGAAFLAGGAGATIAFGYALIFAAGNEV